MKTSASNPFNRVPTAGRRDAVASTSTAASESSAVLLREGTRGMEGAPVPETLARLARPSGTRRAGVASGTDLPAINKTMRKLMTLAAVSWPVRNALQAVNAQATNSQRPNPPTLDSLQQCDAQQLDDHKAFLVSQNAYSPDLAMLCVDARTYRRYVNPRFSEAETNCYGDAIGIAGRINPQGVFLGDRHRCEALIDGALKDGAVRAENDRCPDDRRQMQFFITQDRLDYHVISRGKNDATWMNKFTGSPRFPVTIAGATVPRLSGGGITWIFTDPQGELMIRKQQVQDYSIHCPEILCSLPEKITNPKHDL